MRAVIRMDGTIFLNQPLIIIAKAFRIDAHIIGRLNVILSEVQSQPFLHDDFDHDQDIVWKQPEGYVQQSGHNII